MPACEQPSTRTRSIVTALEFFSTTTPRAAFLTWTRRTSADPLRISMAAYAVGAAVPSMVRSEMVPACT
jgi:hypothetical protein